MCHLPDELPWYRQAELIITLVLCAMLASAVVWHYLNLSQWAEEGFEYIKALEQALEEALGHAMTDVHEAVDSAKDHMQEAVGMAKEQVQGAMGSAKSHGAHIVDAAKEHAAHGADIAKQGALRTIQTGQHVSSTALQMGQTKNMEQMVATPKRAAKALGSKALQSGQVIDLRLL
jgi:vacuolar-type H+-ATPase subunit H